MLRFITCILLVTALVHADRPADYVERVKGRQVVAKPYQSWLTDIYPGLKLTDQAAVIELQMVGIPGGTFTMGSPPEEKGRRDDEGPQVDVEVEPLWMSRYEVTWELFIQYLDQYSLTMAKKPDRDLATRPDAVSLPTPIYESTNAILGAYGAESRHPAAGMRQLTARQFTKWLSQKTGRFYRLPTEAEWEYACRAGSLSAWCFGDDPSKLKQYAWWYDHGSTQEGDTQLHPVGQLRPNAWGLYDMHGNVQEWVIDQYDPQWYRQFMGRKVRAAEMINWPTKEYSRVVRGGSSYHYAEELRTSYRMHSKPEWLEMDTQIPRSLWWLAGGDEAMLTGFRVVRPVTEPNNEQKRRFWEADVDWMVQVVRKNSNRDQELRVPISRDGDE